mmetsp:Transcript_20806/g.52342  ORF Transcript_20806/g.52342 Transcript_20806/m.52342 type:complete len:229 (-) Transcript_20806:275-961(-)
MPTASRQPRRYPAKLRVRRLTHSRPIMICICDSPRMPSPWCSSCMAACPGWLMALRPLRGAILIRSCFRCILSARPPIPGIHIRRRDKLRSHVRTARLPDDRTMPVTLSLRGASNQVAVVPSLAPPPLTSVQRDDPERLRGRDPEDRFLGSEPAEALRGMGERGDRDPEVEVPSSGLPARRIPLRPARMTSQPTVPGENKRANPDSCDALSESASMAGPRWMRLRRPT